MDNKTLETMKNIDWKPFAIWWNDKIVKAKAIAIDEGKDFSNKDESLQCLHKAISNEIEGENWDEKMKCISKRFSIDINDPKGYAEAMRLVDKTDETDKKVARHIELTGGSFKDFKTYRKALQELSKMGDL